jgi:phosphoglycerate dehydrogenase-like enzyme
LSTSIHFVGHAIVTQLEGRTLGLIGLGAIGSGVAVLARPFGMRMLTATFGPDRGRPGR